MSMSLDLAENIVDATLKAARSKEAKPLAVIVLDSGGHPVVFRREDGASLFRHDIAKAKAMGALGMGANTRVIAERAKGNPVFFNSVVAATDGNIALSPGGVLIKSENGELIGAIGISGDTGEMDEACAFAGIEAAIPSS